MLTCRVCWAGQYLVVPNTTRASVVMDVRVAIHSKLCSITPMAIKVHVVLRSFVVLSWMHDAVELVWHVTLWNNTKEM